MWLVALVGIIGGVAIAVQAPLASMLNDRMGVLESLFVIHLGGAIFAGVPLALAGGGQLANAPQAPWYALCAGIFGLTVVAAMVYMVPRIGVAGAVILIVAGQISVAALIDHFGWLGVPAQSLDLTRVAGMVLVFVGVWFAVRPAA
ncbi:MAG: DMT family transporter [Gammaproteobacteria bacterium]|nr:DMT family transporter [Gammaproteobacteria bacterium]NND61170.1 DMT family transporter [Gammaproteobacteria bacterium]